MSDMIELRLTSPLYCAPCKRTSYRWWFEFDIDKNACYHLCCMVCARKMFDVRITDRNIRVYDSHGSAVGYVTK